MIGRNLPFQAAMKVANVRYEPAKFNWIGSPEVGNTIAVVVGGAPARTAQDLFQQEILMGGAGAGTAVSVMPVVLAKLLGMKFKLVEGYGSATNVMLAMDRGEVHGLFITLSGARSARPGWIESGKLRVLFNMETKRVPGLDAPSIFELAKTDEQRQLLGLMSISNEFGRPVLAPPNVPAERVAALRAAFQAAMKDRELLAEAAKARFPVNVVSGDELTSLVERLNATPRELIEKMNAMSK
jgi:tripartite-type tricarboxylate transporter receptor subunit TctC